MRLKKVISEKMFMLKHNPKVLFYWGYKISNLFKENVLNQGERYDPNIFKKFNINDAHQEGRYLLAQKFISPDETVLDIACGTGYGTLMLAEKCLYITGFDISQVAIQYARKHYKLRPNINFIQSDIFSITDHADVIVSFETIEHIKGDIKNIIFKLLSLADKKLICSVPYQEQAGVNSHHFHSNISESGFISFESTYQVQFFYQSKNGRLSNSKHNIETYSLIVVINKGNK